MWQNRAFHVEVHGAGSAATGTAVGSHAGAVVEPANDRGVCRDRHRNGAPGSGGPVNYWDIGVRGDTGPTNHGSGFTLPPRNSAFSVTGTSYAGNGNVIGTNPAVVAQYCNGSRLPPEGGGNAGGYKAPAGRSETTGLYPVFALNQTQVAATVDEGNNWINLVFGPLSLSNAASYTAPNASLTPLADYRLQASSPNSVRNGGLNSTGIVNLIPDHDFLGNSRPRNASNPASIGAVEAP